MKHFNISTAGVFDSASTCIYWSTLLDMISSNKKKKKKKEKKKERKKRKKKEKKKKEEKKEKKKRRKKIKRKEKRERLIGRFWPNTHVLEQTQLLVGGWQTRTPPQQVPAPPSGAVGGQTSCKNILHCPQPPWEELGGNAACLWQVQPSLATLLQSRS